jgi:ketosteroid isomerase-like protein
MSQENVEQTKRAADAYNRRNVEALLEELDPEVEWHSALSILLSGKATVYRGHAGVREWFRELDEVLDEIHVEYTDIRDLGDRVIAIGRIRTRGRGSGVVTESPIAMVSDTRNGKSVRVRSYLDRAEALEAAGLSE